MKIYTARQPIFNTRKQVVAYELLYRESDANRFPTHVSSEVATSKLLLNSFFEMDPEHLTRSLPVLINFPSVLLNDCLIDLLPPGNVVVEVLETVEPTMENLRLFKALAHKGYKLALDDFVYSAEWEPFFRYVKMIKFDLCATPLPTILPLVQRLLAQGRIKLLAEKVETKQEFDACREAGFHYFQGYFFAKPEIVEGKKLEPSTHMVMNIYRELSNPNLSYDRVARYFEQEPTLAHKLLKYVNTLVVSTDREISSLRQAIAYMGEVKLRSFVALFMASQINHNKPSELVRLALVRSRLFQQLLRGSKYRQKDELGFLTGLLSTLDAMLDQPMPEIIKRLPLDTEIKVALEGGEGMLSDYLRLVTSYEKADWNNVRAITQQLDIDENRLVSAYQEAVLWEQRCFNTLAA